MLIHDKRFTSSLALLFIPLLPLPAIAHETADSTAPLIGNQVPTGVPDTHHTAGVISDIQELGIGTAHPATRFEIVDDAQPLNYAGTPAAMVIQARDSRNGRAATFSPSVVFQMNLTGDGLVDAAAERSYSIWQGIFGTIRKTGDGSGQTFTATGELGASGAGHYNELGGFQYELTNIGSSRGTISGVEGIVKDSADGGVTHHSTRMAGVISRLVKYDPTPRGSRNFLASSEGSQPIDAVMEINPDGGTQLWRRGLDLRLGHFESLIAISLPNDTALAWMTSGGAEIPILGMSSQDRVHLSGPKDMIDIASHDSRTAVTFSLSDGAASVAPTSGNIALGTAGAPWNGLYTRNINLHSSAPKSSSSRCSKGDLTWDASYLYVCTAPNHWRRTGLTDF